MEKHQTKVVNVKVEHIRNNSPPYNNLSEWMSNSNNVYIGRKGIVFIDGKRFPPKDSIWHNPYKINDKIDRTSTIDRYRKFIINKIRCEELTDQLLELKGKNLGCWCKPNECHGDVLVELINKYQNIELTKQLITEPSDKILNKLLPSDELLININQLLNEVKHMKFIKYNKMT